MTNEYTRDFYPIEKNILKQVEMNIKLLENSLEELKSKGKTIFQLTGLITASLITTLGLFVRNYPEYVISKYFITIIVVLILIIIYNFLRLIYLTSKEILTPDNIQLEEPIKFAAYNLGEDVSDLSTYIVNLRASQLIYYNSLNQHSKNYEQVIMKMARNWFFYAFTSVILLILLFIS
jgi:hypothetical protein